MKLAAIVGTNAPQSYNRKLLQYMQRHFSAQVEIEVLEIDGIPLFNEQDAQNGHLPATAETLKEKVMAADGVVFGVPEYDHDIPSVLKSSLEWLSYTVHPFNNKPVMLVGTSLGIQGTSRAQDELRRILNSPGLNAFVLPGHEFMLSFAQKAFDKSGNLTDSQTVTFLENCVGDFLALIQSLSGHQSLNVKWQGGYDVIVLGFGGAGATAARFAADKGAKVLVVDAAPFGHEGGNTRYSAQHVVTGNDVTQLTEYYHQLNAPFVTPAKTLNAYLTGMANIPTYFKKYLSVTPVSWKNDIHPGDSVAVKKTMAEYPEFKGSETVDFALVHKRDKDAALWKVLRKNVLARSENIDVWLDSRAQHLIQDPVSRIVRGVQITRNNKQYNMYAKNGVVLAMGGFENNPEMIGTYLHFDRLTPLGTLYNRGDGIRMAQEVRAKMWHMANYESHGILPGITFAEDPGHRGTQIDHWPLLNHGSIFVASDDGTRYFKEDSPHRHGHINIHGSWLIPMHNLHPYLIFDNHQYSEFKAQLAEDGRLPYPKFMEKLVQASTVSKLAEKIGLPASNLEDTVQQFNTFKANGRDDAFGRDPQTMRSFDNGPYFAIAVAGDVLNTQGGPERNQNAQIIDVNNQPIPHLYGAGELGGIVANCYQGGGNLAECLIFGKLAGENAAVEKRDADDVSVSAKNMNGVNDLVSGESAAAISVGKDQYLGMSNSGLGGKIIVRVTYSNDEIQNVEVVQQHETEEVGLAAVKKLPQEIVKENSTDVDAISGASASSRAIKEAVQDALKKARQHQKV